MHCVINCGTASCAVLGAIFVWGEFGRLWNCCGFCPKKCGQDLAAKLRGGGVLQNGAAMRQFAGGRGVL
ncbi:MAG: hypothetical protein ACR2P5_05555 [Gammaproteobacteria bacterium]